MDKREKKIVAHLGKNQW